MRMKLLQPRRLRGYCTSKQWECPDTPEKHLPGQTPENAHSVRRRILRMFGFEPGQIVCPGSFYSQQYLDEILFPLYISV